VHITTIINIKILCGILPGHVKALRGSALADVETIEDAWLTIKDGSIHGFGQMLNLDMNELDGSEVIDATGRLVLPAFVDSHTHLVHAGTREDEWIMRLQGLTYADIAARGGGILSSATKLQNAPIDILIEDGLQKLIAVAKMGTGSIEIKSGYGLSHDAEIKMLRVIKVLKEQSPLRIKSTFLALHAIPKANKFNPDAFVDDMINRTLPHVVDEGLADFVDAFCEDGYFTNAQTMRLVAAAHKYGLPAKIHVNQFKSTGAIAELVAAEALSVDHLEVMSEGDMEALRGSNTVATILPACSSFISIPYAPARKLIENNTIVALASDYNPGSSPTANMQLVQSLACMHMAMLPNEAFNAATINGSAALHLSHQVGSITIGKKADLIITDPIPSLGYMAYNFGHNHVWKIMVNGKEIKK